MTGPWRSIMIPHLTLVSFWALLIISMSTLCSLFWIVDMLIRKILVPSWISLHIASYIHLSDISLYQVTSVFTKSSANLSLSKKLIWSLITGTLLELLFCHFLKKLLKVLLWGIPFIAFIWWGLKPLDLRYRPTWHILLLLELSFISFIQLFEGLLSLSHF